MRFTQPTLWLCALLVLGGCGEDPVVPPPAPAELSAVQVTCTPASVTVGQASQCMASATDQYGKSFAVSGYTWTSSAESIATVDATGKVSTVGVGSATISATATVGAISKTGQASLTVNRVPGTDHSTNITANETWRAADNPHVVRANIDVGGANAPTLTLEAGVEIRFAPGFGLSITNGALKAQGTQAAPIRMVSNQGSPAKGDWQGLVFSAAGSASELSYVTMSHCGKDTGDRACVSMKRQAAPVLRNVTIQNSGSAGVVVADDGSAFGPGSTVLSVSGSASYAVRIGANQAGTVPVGGTFAGNAPDAVELRGMVSSTQTWASLGIPYVVNDLVYVEGSSAPTLTLAAGTVLRFGSDKGLYIGDQARGDLIVSGTAAAPVLLTADSATPQPGHWRGVHLMSRSTTSSSISYATIEYAGSGGGTETGNLNLYGNISGGGAHPVINNVTVQKGSGYGVYVLNDGAFGAGSTVLNAHDNGSYAISVEPNYVWTIPTGGSITGNTRNAVEIRCCIVATTQTWPNLGIPYVVNAEVYVADNSSPTLTLSEGTELRFGADSGFQIGPGTTPGALKAVGTAAAPIRFVADTDPDTRGHWRGLHFWQASGSQLTYVTVSQAGAAGSIGTGNVNVYREIGAFMTHSTLSKSSGCGVTLSNGSRAGTVRVTTDFTNPDYSNTFSLNTGGSQCLN